MALNEQERQIAEFGAKNGKSSLEIQKAISSYRATQIPQERGLLSKAGGFMFPTATKTIEKLGKGEDLTGRDVLGSALEVGSLLVPAGAIARGVGLGVKGAGLLARTAQTSAVGAVSGGLAGAGRATGEGEDIGEIAKEAVGSAAAGAVIGGALPGGVAGAVGTKNLVSKFAGKITPDAEQIMQRVARISKGQQASFEQTAGESIGKYLDKRGIYGNIDQISQKLSTKFIGSIKTADKALESLPGTYKATPIKTALEQLLKRERSISTPGAFSKDFKTVRELANKFNKEGLTMSETNKVKRLFERNVKLEFKKSLSSSPESVARATTIDDAIRTWQFGQAEKLGLKNLGEINRETRLAKQLLDSIGKEYAGSAGNNAIGLSDWVVLSGGDPTAVSAFLVKKGFSSKTIQSAIAKFISKSEKMPPVKATFGEPKKGLVDLLKSEATRAKQ